VALFNEEMLYYQFHCPYLYPKNAKSSAEAELLFCNIIRSRAFVKRVSRSELLFQIFFASQHTDTLRQAQGPFGAKREKK